MIQNKTIQYEEVLKINDIALVSNQHEHKYYLYLYYTNDERIDYEVTQDFYNVFNEFLLK